MKFATKLKNLLLAAFLAHSGAAWAGNIYLTGHDVLLHGGQNGYWQVILDFLRGAGTADEIPAANYRIAYLCSTCNSIMTGYGGITNYDPATMTAAQWTDAFSKDVIVIEWAPYLTSTALTELNNHASDFETFINAGGDLWMQSSYIYTNYYTILPPSVASTGNSISASSGFTATSAGAAIGITSNMINGFATHNNFTTVASAMTVYEVYGTTPISIGVRNASISGGAVVSNSAPVAADGTLAVARNTATEGVLGATDAESDPLTFSIVAAPSLGTVTITDTATGAYRYTPTAGVSGTDTFTFKANDGTADSNTATVTVTIAANTAPLAVTGNLSVDYDTVATGVMSATDTDGDALTFSVVGAPNHGIVTITDAATGAYRYTPNAGASGSDSFTFKANDGTTDSNTAVVSVTIAPPSGTDVVISGSGGSRHGGGALDPWLLGALAALLARRYTRKVKHG